MPEHVQKQYIYIYIKLKKYLKELVKDISMAYHLTMAKHTKEGLESFVDDGHKLSSSWPISEFLV